jgi:hypothetical protein
MVSKVYAEYDVCRLHGQSHHNPVVIRMQGDTQRHQPTRQAALLKTASAGQRAIRRRWPPTQGLGRWRGTRVLADDIGADQTGLRTG